MNASPLTAGAPAFAITAMTVGDHAGCVALWSATENIGAAPDPAAFAAFIARNPGFSPVARADGRIVGAMMASFDGIRGYYYRLAVDRAWRRHGVATALVAHATDQLRAAGAERVNLHIFADNHAAKEFWADAGFTPYAGLEAWKQTWA